MKIKNILFILVFLSIIFITNRSVFPLGSGTLSYGIIAVNNMKKYNVTDITYVDPLDSTYKLVAVIVEPREDNLINTIDLFLQTLPDYTHFQVYHGTNNEKLIVDTYSDLIKSGKMSIYNMGVHNLTIQSYSYLLTSKHFYNTIKSENILIFQTDAVTCSNSMQIIEDYYNYDYVGAPVPKYIGVLINILFIVKGYNLGHLNFYNGGLSFRKKSKMLELIKKYPWDQLTPEDVWICSFLPFLKGSKIAPREIARNFSFESEKIANIPWGVHKPRKKYDLLSKICPEIKNIPFVKSHSDYRNLYML